MIEKKPAILFSENTIRDRVKELARRISEDYAGVEEVLLVGILRGCYIFLADLSRLLTIPRSVDFMAVSSYPHDATRGALRLIMDTRNDIAGKHVLIVEDIVDTGHTLHYLLNMLSARKPASLKTCAFLRKLDRLEREVDIDYLGFDIPDVWVVGYGLDFADRYRALPYVGYIEHEEV
ncbi:MAG TPA: hypoxanthine phosphoribosyltransferase [Geobacteraceae bacterium]|nr:hypoxanthine phosphoribosyltransferase [Geobacteraceae bacterium]